jgi:hypothetical protein
MTNVGRVDYISGCPSLTCVDWDQYINLNTCSACIAELFFWLNNLSLLSPLDLFISDCSTDFYIFSDASETGAAGYIVNSPYICHKTWLDHEKVKSSTWREIKAIQLTLKTFATKSS